MNTFPPPLIVDETPIKYHPEFYVTLQKIIEDMQKHNASIDVLVGETSFGVFETIVYNNKAII